MLALKRERTSQISMHVPADLRKAVDVAAARMGASKTALWIEAMRQYLNQAKNGGKK